jgi:hypothetical protein
MVCTTRNFAGDDVNELSALSNFGSSDRSEATRDAISSIVYAVSVCKRWVVFGIWVTTEGREDVSVHGPSPSMFPCSH